MIRVVLVNAGGGGQGYELEAPGVQSRSLGRRYAFVELRAVRGVIIRIKTRRHSPPAVAPETRKVKC